MKLTVKELQKIINLVMSSDDMTVTVKHKKIILEASTSYLIQDYNVVSMLTLLTALGYSYVNNSDDRYYHVTILNP